MGSCTYARSHAPRSIQTESQSLRANEALDVVNDAVAGSRLAGRINVSGKSVHMLSSSSLTFPW